MALPSHALPPAPASWELRPDMTVEEKARAVEMLLHKSRLANSDGGADTGRPISAAASTPSRTEPELMDATQLAEETQTSLDERIEQIRAEHLKETQKLETLLVQRRAALKAIEASTSAGGSGSHVASPPASECTAASPGRVAAVAVAPEDAPTPAPVVESATPPVVAPESIEAPGTDPVAVAPDDPAAGPLVPPAEDASIPDTAPRPPKRARRSNLTDEEKRRSSTRMRWRASSPSGRRGWAGCGLATCRIILELPRPIRR